MEKLNGVVELLLFSLLMKKGRKFCGMQENCNFVVLLRLFLFSMFFWMVLWLDKKMQTKKHIDHRHDQRISLYCVQLNLMNPDHRLYKRYSSGRLKS